MDAPSVPCAAQRRASWALVLALLPMLTFMGHWPASVPIPGTDLYVVVPLAGGTSDESESHHDHSRHCHGEAASCADAPVAAGIGLALMNTPVAISAATGLLLLAFLAVALPWRSNTLTPELRPPRPATHAA